MTHKALIIEDSTSLAKAMQAELKQTYDIDSDIAVNMQDATLKVKENDGQYFVASVDLQLPDGELGSGLTLMDQFNIPSIVFTGQLDTHLRKELSSRALIDYVLKSDATGIHYICWLIDRIYCNKRFKVLIVDDSPSALSTMNALLQNQNFNTICVADGKGALEALEHDPDIIVLDQYLPDIMGYDLCREIRSKIKTPLLQIIGVSSKGDLETAALFLKSGGNDYLQRPYNPEEFAYRINLRADFIDRFNQLAQLNQQKNMFLGMAAHDLRNPNNVIQHAARHLLKDDLSASRQKELIELIARSSASIQHLLNDLLDISAIEKKEFTVNVIPLNFVELIEERINLIKDSAIKKEIKIETSLPQSAMVEVDPMRIVQVIDNLLSNALKYSHKTSKIMVSLEKQVDNILFSVDDQGPGIKIKDRSKLFIAFSRLGHTTTGGESSHGLGLSICLKIIEAHNGAIDYKDSSLGGSCFYFTLPK